MSYPKLNSRTREASDIVLNVDLAPTIASVAGVTIPDQTNGISLLPILQGGSISRHEQLIEYWQGVSTIPDYIGIRTPQYKYVEYSTGDKELYVLDVDPYELNNRISDPSLNTKRQELKTRLNILANS